MICLPAGVGAVRPAGDGASRSVSFVGSTGAGYIASGTSINSPSSPAGIAAGDGLYAFVFARSALSPPAGWTLVASKANTGTLTQTLYVYRKDTVATGDSSTAFTWTQAASGRMGLAYVVVRSNSGSIVEAGTSSAETDYASSTAYPQNVIIPTLTATEEGELFLVCASSETGGSAGVDAWAVASGATLRTPAATANRLVVATQARNTGQANATPMTFLPDAAGGGGTNYYSAITVRLQP